MRKTQKGFGTIEALIIVVIVVIVGLIGWRVGHHGKANSPASTATTSTSAQKSSSSSSSSKGQTTKSTSSGTASTTTSSSSQPAAPDNSTSLLSGAIKVTLPANWTKLSDSSISRMLNGSKYVADFSLSSTDELTTSNNVYNNDISDLGSVTDTKGTTLSADRSDADTYNSWVYANGCNADVCSPKIGNQYLLIVVSDQTSGQPQKLYFRYSNSDANTILGDFFQVLQSSNI